MRNKRGSASILAVISTSFIMIIFMLILSNFVTIQSYKSIEREVDTLQNIVAKKGGLPYQDLDAFKKRVTKQQSYLQDKSSNISVSAYTEKGNIDCLNTVDLNEDGFYIDKNVNDLIVLRVSLPSNVSWFKQVTSFFTDKEITNLYNYERHIVSQREIPEIKIEGGKIN